MSLRLRLTVLIVLVILAVYFTYLSLRTSNWEISKESSKYLAANATDFLQQSSRTILVWTTRYGSPQKRWAKIIQGHLQDSCPCVVTENRTRITEADALLFMLWPGDLDTDDLPPVRMRHQYYVAYDIEAPNRVSFQDSSWWDGLPPDFFNVTMTYRPDSDFPIPYLEFGNRSKPARDFSLGDIELEKRKMAVWFVSHCSTTSKREKYVEELSKHISVDIFGACGNKTNCRRTDKKCMRRMTSGYNFYLSLENSLCSHYHTEKLAYPLSMPVIPIVLAANTTALVAPPDSFIHVGSFSSPRHLANYMKELVANRTKYEKYFDWRSTYHVTEGWGLQYRAYCRLCQFLSQGSRSTRIIADFKQWFQKGQCFEPFF